MKRSLSAQNTGEINYGVRLYQRGMKQAEELKQNMEKKKQEQIQ